MTNNKNVSAGEEVDSKCLKCKAVTNHTIIAMVEETIAKVECNVCKARHKYRSPDQPKKTTKRKAAKKGVKGKTTSAKKTKTLQNYEKLIAGKDPEAASSYTISGNFNDDDLISHPKFGLGLVVDIIMPNKVEVFFQDGSKLLVCGKHNLHPND